ncbi:MAG: tRNA (guanosine(37)-N1)-methyltransferase TrmD [Hyphomicrobiaceae bacterium]
MSDTQDEKAKVEATWRACVVTLFPEMFPGPLGHSLAGQALEDKIWSLETTPLRAFGIGRHQNVDDTPAGGGAGMVIRADVLGPAIDAALQTNPKARRIYLSPRGRPLDQNLAHELADGPGVLLVAGRFEGIDQRVIDARQLEEVSIGDYILSGGELAAMVLLDAVVRLLPGVVGASESLNLESFETGLLEHPHYTRPRSWEGRDIPDVLLSGDHAKIESWRDGKARALTKQRRPDLIKKHDE